MTYFIIFFLILIVLHLYKKIWNLLEKNNVPTGAGIILVLFVVFLFIFDQSFYAINYQSIILFLSMLTLIYYIDDLYNLSIAFRITLQIIMGLLIAYILFYNLSYLNFYTFMLITLSLTSSSILLTNTINFYDGADLNVSVFAILNLTVLLVVFNSSYEINNIIIISLIFFLVFSLFNYKENNLYFGDAGSFFLAGLFLIFISYAFINSNLNIIYLLITLSLPVLDVTYVIFYRYYLGEPLYTRHFYQIYQIAKEKQKNHMYLLIQPVNAVLVSLSIYILIKLGVNMTYSVIGSSLLITLIYYFLLRHYLLRDNIKR